MTKAVLITVAVVILLALDWAALHDILKGEPDLSSEYAVVVSSALIFGAMFVVWLRKSKRRPSRSV